MQDTVASNSSPVKEPISNSKVKSHGVLIAELFAAQQKTLRAAEEDRS